MSVTDVLGRMQQIEAQFAQLRLAPSADSAASATSFATALGDATATTAAGATSTVGATGAATSSGVTGDDVVKAAEQYVGTPYVLGGESKSGIDCSGLVQASFKSLGVDVPRLVHEQQTIGTKVDSLKDAQPGDLIVLNGGDHIAIYAGNDTVIHAPYAGRTVSVQKAWFDDKDIVTIRRVVPATADTTAATGAASTTAATTTAASGQAAALLAMYGTGSSTGTDSSTGAAGTSMASLLSSFGASGASSSSSTLQQLLAAQAGLTSGAAA